MTHGCERKRQRRLATKKKSISDRALVSFFVGEMGSALQSYDLKKSNFFSRLSVARVLREREIKRVRVKTVFLLAKMSEEALNIFLPLWQVGQLHGCI